MKSRCNTLSTIDGSSAKLCMAMQTSGDSGLNGAMRDDVPKATGWRSTGRSIFTSQRHRD